MSSGRQYTVSVKLKDDDKVLQKIEKLETEGLQVKLPAQRIEKPKTRKEEGAQAISGEPEPPRTDIFKQMEKLKREQTTGDPLGNLQKKLGEAQERSPISPSGSDELSQKMTDMGKKTGENNDIFKKMEKLNIAQLGALIGIGVGIAGMTALLVKSSGLLQGTLKILETSLLLVFRPFGDFIALALRPLALALLALAIPFYTVAGKWFRTYGNDIGQALLEMFTGTGRFELDPRKADPNRLDARFVAFMDEFGVVWASFLTQLAADLASLPSKIKEAVTNFFTDLGTAGDTITKFWVRLGEEIWLNLGEAGSMITKFWSSLGEKIWLGIGEAGETITKFWTNLGKEIWLNLEPVPGQIQGFFTELGTNLGLHLQTIPPFLLKIFLDFGMNVWNFLLGVPQTFLNTFTNLTTNIGTLLGDVPGTLLDVFTGLASNIQTTLANIPQLIWDAIMAMFKSAQKSFGFDSRGGTIQSNIQQGGTSINNNPTTMAAVADTLP